MVTILKGFIMLNLKAAIRAANLTQEQWALTQGIAPNAASKMSTGGAIVINEIVYRPTKYRVPARSKGES